jgi:hypothetical protein
VVNLGLDTAICQGSTLTLDAQNTGSTYTWSNNSSNQTLAVTTAGTYSVTVKDANGCKGSDAIVVSVNALPTAGTLTYTNKGNCEFDFGVTTPANITNYAWDFGDGSPVVNTAIASTTHSFDNEGSHTVSVTMTNTCGQVVKQVTFNCIKAGVEELGLSSRLTLYPNPTASDVTVETQGGVMMESITVIDNLGKVVYQVTPTDKVNYLVNVSHLANGFYTMLIHTDNGVAMKKFEVMK